MLKNLFTKLFKKDKKQMTYEQAIEVGLAEHSALGLQHVNFEEFKQSMCSKNTIKLKEK